MARVAIVAVPLLVAVVLHEVAHGAVAYACGDPTAARAGRLTLNPIAHIDLVGSILVPGLLVLFASPFVFGWAKPVPTDPRWFRRPRMDGLLVAIAGPGTNLTLAALSAVALGALAAAQPTVTTVFLRSVAAQSVVINCVLAVFNLLPIPPLDGGRVLAAVLPPWGVQALAQLERFGFIIVLLLMMNTNILQRLVRPVLAWYQALAQQVAG